MEDARGVLRDLGERGGRGMERPDGDEGEEEESEEERERERRRREKMRGRERDEGASPYGERVVMLWI